MTPNLLVALQTLSSPQKWFSHKRPADTIAPVEHWDTPIPGKYEFVPGEGWYLVTPDKASDIAQPFEPTRVIYSRVLKRFLLQPEYQARRRKAPLPVPGRSGQLTHNSKELVGFLRLDDGITWVNDEDTCGKFIEGPYPRFFYDQTMQRFRTMVKGDDPSRQSSRSNSRVASSAASMTSERHSSNLSPDRRTSVPSITDAARNRPGSARAGSSKSLISTINRADGATSSRRPSRQLIPD